MKHLQSESMYKVFTDETPLHTKGLCMLSSSMFHCPVYSCREAAGTTTTGYMLAECMLVAEEERHESIMSLQSPSRTVTVNHPLPQPR